MLNEHTRELISAQQMSHKHNSTGPSCLQHLSPGMSVNTRYINSTKGPLGQLMSLLFSLSTFVRFHSLCLPVFLHGHLTKTTVFYPEIAMLGLGKEARNKKLCNIKPFSKSAEAVSAFSKTNHPTTIDLLSSALHQTLFLTIKTTFRNE